MDEINIDNFNSKQNHKEIFLNLHEIFGEVVSTNNISRICCDCKWNFDSCVQALIKYTEENPKDIYNNSAPKIFQTETLLKNKNLIQHDKYAEPLSEKKQGAIPKNLNICYNDTLTERISKSQNDFQNLPDLKTILRHINSGHKIMIIMRGAPGAGKTFVAKKIIDLTVKGDYTQFIHSTDNYFYNGSNKYCYDPQSLSDAHDYNQKIVKSKAVEGWSPLIVDNTNTKIWEMLPYVKIAVQNGYLIEIIHPNTPWCNSAAKLSKKNTHGVPKKKIENILNNFEPINKDQIIKLLKTTHYLVPLPQMRRQPNIPFKLDFNTDRTNVNCMLSENSTTDKLLSSNKMNKEKNISTPLALPDGCLLSSHIPEYEKHGNRSYNNEKIILRDNCTHENIYSQPVNTDVLQKSSNKENFEIHAINCPNENKSFSTIRQIYPNKSFLELWNLFVNYNGVTDSLIEDLLNEKFSTIENSQNHNASIIFTCKCEVQNKEINEDSLHNKIHNEISHYENYITLTNENFSNRLRNNDNHNQISTDNINRLNELQIEKIPLEDINKDKPAIDKENDLCEIKLGEELIQQLENIFGIDSKLKDSISNYHSNVFMPKSLAKDLYALWMESLYNQKEEQKHLNIKQDEAFAKFLELYLIESDNIGIDVVDNIELAWFKCNSDSTTQKNLEFYSHLIKLFQMFPQIQKEIIIDVFQAYDNSLDETIMVLNNSINSSDCNKLNFLNSKNGKFYNEHAKRAALRDFETSRNHAAHHSQLKAECFEKAKDAIKRNSPSVAVYYSHIANFHNTKIDMCNQKAANCILEVNDWKQSNPDFIDLHYLHSLEAIECLDLFLDKHINKLKNITRTYKYVFIITGRGLHSAGGISTIKNKVKTRLKERNLKWSEVNPGLLKVKLFTLSKFSQDY